MGRFYLCKLSIQLIANFKNVILVKKKINLPSLTQLHDNVIVVRCDFWECIFTV